MKLVFAHSYRTKKNSHECANEDTLWQTVQFLVHAGTRMIVDSCVAVPAGSIGMLSLSKTMQTLEVCTPGLLHTRENCN